MDFDPPTDSEIHTMSCPAFLLFDYHRPFALSKRIGLYRAFIPVGELGVIRGCFRDIVALRLRSI